jgi:hypothetical protein
VIVQKNLITNAKPNMCRGVLYIFFVRADTFRPQMVEWVARWRCPKCLCLFLSCLYQDPASLPMSRWQRARRESLHDAAAW